MLGTRVAKTFLEPGLVHQKLKIMKTKLGLCALFAGALLAAAPSAQAISYDITSDHATGGLGTPPFGTVTLLQNGANVDITVDLAAGYSFILTGAADFQDFKFNGVGIALGDITVDQNAIYPLVATTGAFNGDGTGEFDFGITGTGQPNGLAGGFNTDIVFHVANATIADLTVPNNLGNIFVVDLYSVATGNTGPADVTAPGTPRNVPDGGATVMLLGVGLAALGAGRRLLKF